MSAVLYAVADGALVLFANYHSLAVVTNFRREKGQIAEEKEEEDEVTEEVGSSERSRSTKDECRCERCTA